MPMPTISKVIQVYNEIQVIFAIIFGMVVQFVFGDKRTLKVGIFIFTSAIFVAMYLVPLFLELLKTAIDVNIEGDSKIAITMYALSSLLSMEILAMTIGLLPEVLKIRVNKFFGINYDKSK